MVTIALHSERHWEILLLQFREASQHLRATETNLPDPETSESAVTFC